MRFAQTHIVIGLWGLIGFALFLSWAYHHRKKMMAYFAQDSLLKDIALRFDIKIVRNKNMILTAVMFFSVIALMRPQWGFQWQEVKRRGIDILVLIDTSKSMLAQDVKPNRLERTKFAVQDLLKKLKGDRVGLIAFAGEAFLVCPLTVDYGGFQINLNDLNVETIPRGGTNVGKAIRKAIEDYDETSNQHKAVIVITDGDNLEGDPISAARQAKEKGIKIYSVGIGSSDGELIRTRGPQGELVFLKDKEGNFVKSRLNEKLLKEISLITGGVYVKASGSQFGLDVIYDRELSKFQKRDIEAKMEKKYFERFQIPLGIALLLLVIETCLTTRKKLYPGKASS